MWNRLPSGLEIDLTRDQFKRGEVIADPTARPRPEKVDRDHPRYHRFGKYLVLSDRVQTRLGLSS